MSEALNLHDQLRLTSGRVVQVFLDHGETISVVDTAADECFVVKREEIEAFRRFQKGTPPTYGEWGVLRHGGAKEEG